MNILLLTRYDRLGASSRVRSFQYIKYLEGRGHSVTVSPLFSNEYLDALYQGKGRARYVISAYFRRFLVLFKISVYDLVVIEKEVFPYLPAVVERLLDCLKVPFVVDYDDALFHRYDSHKSVLFRIILGRKIDVVMKTAAVVVAGNHYLAERAKQAGAREVRVIPTVVDTERYTLLGADRNAGEVTIGWVGTPMTSHYVKPLLPVFNKLMEEYDVRIVLIGASQADFAGASLEVCSWSEATEVAAIQKLNIGIMPLVDSPWERGKCGYKLIQYMACGIPVIASPVGVNIELIQHEKNGFLASTEKEWLYAFKQLLDSQNLREQMGRAAREVVESRYSLNVQKAKLLSAFYRARELK